MLSLGKEPFLTSYVNGKTENLWLVCYKFFIFVKELELFTITSQLEELIDLF